MLSVVMLNVTKNSLMLSVVMLNIVMLNVIVLSVVAPLCYPPPPQFKNFFTLNEMAIFNYIN